MSLLRVASRWTIININVNIDEIFAPLNVDGLATGFRKRSGNVKVIAVPGLTNLLIDCVIRLMGLQ